MKYFFIQDVVISNTQIKEVKENIFNNNLLQATNNQQIFFQKLSEYQCFCLNNKGLEYECK